jgi:hypothetical protein
MAALPHIFKPTLAQVEQTSNGHPTGPLLLFCAAVNIEQDMEADERLAAKPGYNPSVEVPKGGGEEEEEKQANMGGVVKKKKVCTFRVPLQSIRVKREEEEEIQEDRESATSLKSEPHA